MFALIKNGQGRSDRSSPIFENLGYAFSELAFNTWARETGRDLTALSRILAMSTGPEGVGFGS